MTLLNFSELEELLPRNKFVRVHRLFLVAIDKIDHIEKNRMKSADQIISTVIPTEKFFSTLRGIQ